MVKNQIKNLIILLREIEYFGFERGFFSKNRIHLLCFSSCLDESPAALFLEEPLDAYLF